MTPVVAWQHQIKLRLLEGGPCNSPSLPYTSVCVCPIPVTTATEFILRYEWLQTPGHSRYSYGLLIDGHLAAVCSFGRPASPRAYTRMLQLDDPSRLFQLVRGATAPWAPPWAASKCISGALNHLAANRRALVVVAYADPQAGEIGVVYQACNACYVGTTNAGGATMYRIKGQIYHPRTVTRKFGSRARLHIASIDPFFEITPIHPKHRYIFLLGPRSVRRKLRTRLASLIQPYPRRADMLEYPIPCQCPL